MEDDILDGIHDYSEELDYNALKNKIRAVLKRYFEADDNGDDNSEYDPNFEPQAAIDEIREIVGGI